jgi:hypothetical protein
VVTIFQLKVRVSEETAADSSAGLLHPATPAAASPATKALRFTLVLLRLSLSDD